MTATTELSALTAGVWNIDPAHSEVGFSVRHLGAGTPGNERAVYREIEAGS